eukprot:7385758-Prymnesium_polylepis.1
MACSSSEPAASSIECHIQHRRCSITAAKQASRAYSHDELYAGAAAVLDAGDFDVAIERFSKLLESHANSEKMWYSRGMAHLRAGNYARASADFGRYLRLVGPRAKGTGEQQRQSSGTLPETPDCPQPPRLAEVANAHYGRALCASKAGDRMQALDELDESIAAGREDEQLTDRDSSYAPAAAVARFVLRTADAALAEQYRRAAV